MIKNYYRDSDGRIFFLNSEANKVLNDVKKVAPMINKMMQEKQKKSKNKENNITSNS